MLNLLQKVTVSLAAFLGRILPTFSNYSWNQHVLSYLNEDRQRHRKTFAELDLAMLLRVFEKNWVGISKKLALEPEVRNLVREMPTIRNRWAHTTPQGISPNDEYRDLDTLLRFAQVIEADDTFRQEVRNAMLALLPKIKKSLMQGGAIDSKIPPSEPVDSLPVKKISSKQGGATALPEKFKNNEDLTQLRLNLIDDISSIGPSKKRKPKVVFPTKKRKVYKQKESLF